jgi:hypothetical protein
VSAIVGDIEATSDGLLFQCEISERIIQCGIFEQALRDLLDFHRDNSSEDEIYRAVLSEIERIVTAKFQSRRFEDNGWLVVWPVDLLRYGYWRRVHSAA